MVAPQQVWIGWTMIAVAVVGIVILGINHVSSVVGNQTTTKRRMEGSDIAFLMEEPPQHWLRQVRRYFVLKWLPQFLLSLLAYWWLSISRTGIGGHLLFAMLFGSLGDGSLVQIQKYQTTISVRSVYGQ